MVAVASRRCKLWNASDTTTGRFTISENLAIVARPVAQKQANVKVQPTLDWTHPQ